MITKILTILFVICIFFNSSFSQKKHDYTVRYSTFIKHEIEKNDAQDFEIYFNESEKIIAIAHSQKEAKNLAQKIRKVYYILQGETIKNVIERWSKINGYKVIYDVKKDFIIEKSTDIFGEFLAENGALYQLLKSIEKMTNFPLKVEVMQNNVIIVKQNTTSPELLNYPEN